MNDSMPFPESQFPTVGGFTIGKQGPRAVQLLSLFGSSHPKHPETFPWILPKKIHFKGTKWLWTLRNNYHHFSGSKYIIVHQHPQKIWIHEIFWGPKKPWITSHELWIVRGPNKSPKLRVASEHRFLKDLPRAQGRHRARQDGSRHPAGWPWHCHCAVVVTLWCNNGISYGSTVWEGTADPETSSYPSHTS